MKTNDSQAKMRALADLILETINRLSFEGKTLNVDNLMAALDAKKELSDMLAPLPAKEKTRLNEALKSKTELEKLRAQLEKTSAHRRQLATQLDAAENQTIQEKAFIQRSLPALIQLIEPGDNRRLTGILDHIRALAKKNASTEELDNTLQQLKETAFKTELAGDVATGQKKRPLFDLFKRKAPPVTSEAVGHLKHAYLEMVEHLKLNLDQTALSDLTGIEKRLQGDLQPDDFTSIRNDLLALLKAYISRISCEREEAAAFILEIGKRLGEIEQHLLQSIAVTEETRASGSQFTDAVEKEMAVFQEAVDLSTSLEELKSKVVASIASIKRAVESNRKDLSHQNEKSGNEVTFLRKSLDRMKTEIKSARKRSESLEVELLSDPLTRAFNRRAYDQRIGDELKRYLRYKTIFSVLLLDVDHFKQINDRYGHAVGDLCLKEIINRIRPLLRKSDFLARFGGEEFILILPETGNSGAADVAEKIRAHIEKTEFLHKGEHVRVTISLGGTEVNTSDKTGGDIFERADRAMYQAKQSGRNRVVMI